MSNELEQISKNISEWTRDDKGKLLRVQNFASALGIFFSIVQCTNLFEINAQESNTLVLWFAITSLIVTLGNIIALIWSLRQSKKVTVQQDGGEGESTDNQFTRAILFLNVIILVQFAVLYAIYLLGRQDFINQFSANHDTRSIQDYTSYLDGKSGWLNFLSWANILIGLYTIYSAYSLSDSPITHRLQVYLISIITLVLSFVSLHFRNVLRDIFYKASYQYTEWPLRMTFWLIIILIVFLVFTFLANTRKNRVPYMILGAFFLVLTSILIPATGQVFRDYKTIIDKYQSNCVPELGQLDVGYVESQGCPNKYVYKTRASCPYVSTNPTNDCFQDYHTCPILDSQQVWESVLVNSPLSTNILACVNRSCCGTLANIYGRPVLVYAGLLLSLIAYSFILAVFTFQLSARDKGNKDLHASLQYFLLAVFFIILLLGIILASVAVHTYLPQRQQVTAGLELSESPVNVITYQANKQLQHYPRDTCYSFSEFFNENKIFYQTGAGTTPLQVTSYDSLDVLLSQQPAALSANNNYCTSQYPTCERQGYIFALAAPNGQATPNTCRIKFRYSLPTNANNEYLREFADQTTRALFDTADVPAVAANKLDPGYNFFGVIGNQASIESILSQSGNLEVCGYSTEPLHTCANAKIFVRVAQVDLVKFGFDKLDSNGNVVTTTIQESEAQVVSHSHNNLKKLSHKKSSKEHSRNLKYHHQMSEEHLALLASNTEDYLPFSIVVHDLETDKPVQGADLKVYSYKSNPAPGAANQEVQTSYGTVSQPKDFTCQNAFPTNLQLTTPPNIIYPDLWTTTGDDGKGIYNIVFGNNTAAHVPDVSLLIVASKEGYHSNCRYVQFNSQTIANYINSNNDAFDIGLGKQLEVGQTRAVLEWDYGQQIAAGTSDNVPFSLNLWATFGNYQGTDQFDCHVGYTQRSCGSVEYNGNSVTKKNGKSSESITFKAIGQYSYLVYFDRFYNANPLTSSTADATARSSSKWFSHINTFVPVLKYYSAESSFPEVALFDQNSKVFPATNPADSATTAYVLALCVNGKALTTGSTTNPSEKAQDLVGNEYQPSLNFGAAVTNNGANQFGYQPTTPAAAATFKYVWASTPGATLAATDFKDTLYNKMPNTFYSTYSLGTPAHDAYPCYQQ